MIVDCNLLALNNPDDILPYPTYKSGLLDTDKGYVRFGYPSVSYPILNMPYILEDFEGNTLPPGHYQIVLSPDRRTLYFVESNQIKASVPVVKLIEKMVSQEEEKKRIEEQEKIAKKYKNNPRKRPLDQTERKKQASMEASIDNSQPEYYILNYKNGNIKATGYIFK
ncbi:MAG: hypothetical protein V8R83_08550 [Candidatus Gastranaerophilaceae bacterium]|jgi:hypothetical protein|uniref:Uncharacterized protein n=1 Tax=Candidatus Limenecus avicola TaxID=2840847 RepID=A0A9D1N0V2_9CLOT|nr:hypothetical protein [Clostridium sp.]CDC20654.1 unknown [Clostridium sp. CAG:306]DAB23340.1 MAG TPA: hypothetical protein CPT85_05110 [Candidatus Gastranaerophilales bacterium HUM_21]HIU92689.1 hypothetical protein [Candidatus Limenecus avicola]